MRLPVLTYHAVLPVERSALIRGTVPLESFREQIRWLCDRGFTALSLDAAADLLEGKVGDVRRPVVLTFDDGYACVVEHALPVLEQAGFCATLFVVTELVGGESHWYARKGGAPQRHASWAELERARARGFEIGSHGARHLGLSRLDAAQRADELGRSQQEIAKRFGRCAHFAFPYGDAPAGLAAELAACGYRTACTTEPGRNAPGQPLYALRRQAVSRTTTPARFRRRVGRLW